MGYELITCRGCLKKLPVGTAWEGDTEVKCGNCENVQTVEEGR